MPEFRLDPPGNHYIDEVKKKCYHEVVIADNTLYIIERGGPLEPVILTVKVNDGVLIVDDWWGWGNG